MGLKKRSLLNTLLDGVALELSVRLSVITQSLHIRLLAAGYLEGTHEFLVENQGNTDLTCIHSLLVNLTKMESGSHRDHDCGTVHSLQFIQNMKRVICNRPHTYGTSCNTTTGMSCPAVDTGR